MLKKILIGIIVIIGAFLIYVAMQPPTMNISRQMLIKAPPEVIFPHINNNKLADAWMPWAESDPQMKMTYSGPEEGLGATSTWTSEGDMGHGEAKIILSVENKSVKTKLTYTHPMHMIQVADITLQPTAEGTMVIWSVTGDNSFVGRIFCTLFNVEKMVGDEFTKGLTKLKSNC